MSAVSVARGIRHRVGFRSVETMDISSMIMGGAIASVAWIAFVPWSKLRRLKELDAERGDESA
ncbi:tRNA-dihydrouridine synthase [Microbacterium testaceum StLB037]|uniref:tRNA-dihydrouridine synthase n=1 Tax=Microbacterium testaceum (strain StLB037) TaxID=979556 RepID=E8NGI8_MICTS|nr:tRNA-dihydrouridine synthase [Microbacterium testaceum StLB037]